MENGTLNSRLLLLESRVLDLERESKRLSKSMNALHSTDELILHAIETLTSAVESNEKMDETVHEFVQNRIKGLYMRNGKLKKQVDNIQEELKKIVQ